MLPEYLSPQLITTLFVNGVKPQEGVSFDPTQGLWIYLVSEQVEKSASLLPE